MDLGDQKLADSAKEEARKAVFPDFMSGLYAHKELFLTHSSNTSTTIVTYTLKHTCTGIVLTYRV